MHLVLWRGACCRCVFLANQFRCVLNCALVCFVPAPKTCTQPLCLSLHLELSVAFVLRLCRYCDAVCRAHVYMLICCSARAKFRFRISTCELCAFPLQLCSLRAVFCILPDSTEQTSALAGSVVYFCDHREDLTRERPVSIRQIGELP